MSKITNEILIYEKDEIVPIIAGAIDHAWGHVKLVAVLNYKYNTKAFEYYYNPQIAKVSIYYYNHLLYEYIN